LISLPTKFMSAFAKELDDLIAWVTTTN
jgi:hypothetical protein